MSTISRWLNWAPCQTQKIDTPPETEPTEQSRLSFVGFDGSVSRESPIIRGAEPASGRRPDACPYALPEGVWLVSYTPKKPPVAVTVCSVVNDIPKFVRHALDEMDARLHNPVQIRAGDSVFELLSKLADCGLQLRLEWPPQTQIIRDSSESDPSKPTKLPEPSELNSQRIHITDEDMQF